MTSNTIDQGESRSMLTDRPQSIFARYSLDALGRRAGAQLSPREEVLSEAIFFTGFNGVAGDFLEFGTFRGDRIVQAYHTNRAIQQIMAMDNRLSVTGDLRAREKFQSLEAAVRTTRFFAFDSFAGLPAPTEEYEQGLLAAGDVCCPLDEFEENLKINQVERNRVEVVEGFFDETLTDTTKRRENLTSASVVYIDCDLYDSTRVALEFVTDLLTDGTVIIFDDWYLFKGSPDRGEQKAFREWRQKHPGIRVSEYMKNGAVNSFIVHL